MSKRSARLDALSEKERAALREILRRRKQETGTAPAAARTPEAGPSPSATRGAWEEGGTAPASFAQERLWLIERLTPGTATYNIPGAFRLRGRLEVPALARAVSEIVRRQAALRTVFAVEAGRPVQRILPWAPPVLPLVDLSALPDGAREEEVLRRAAAEATRPFDLEKGPLFRFALLILGPREHVALYTMHHVVSDGWSMSVFFREVAALYEAFAAGRRSPLPELPRQVPDLAIRQRSRAGEERLADALAWWTERLRGLAPLELPTDRPRPAARSGRGASRAAVWPGELAERLTAWARGEGATLYMVLLAAFQTLLFRVTGQDDVAVGSAVANRNDRDMEPLIGCFVNTVVIRTGLAGDPPFRELLGRVRETALAAFRHQEAPFERVVEAVQPERQLGRTPLFQVLFTLQNVETGTLELPGLTLERVSAPTATAKLDLSLSAGETPEGLEAHLEIDLDLFEPATGDRLLRHLGRLLEAAPEAPETRLSQMPLLAPAEREQIVHAWNRTALPIPRGLPVHRLFEEQVDRAPDAPAVTSDVEELTYAELDARANRLAHRLRRLGAGPEVPVVVLAERSPDLVAALLAVAKSGGFFVPLDPAHPRERLAGILARSGARLAVTGERFLGLLPEGIESVCLDRDCEALAAEPPGRPEGGATAESLLYVMFTSGSTGEPKGVAVTHGNVVRLARSGFAGLGPGETVLLVAPASFDASTFEIWGPLANGGRIAVFPPHTPALDELAAFLERRGVTLASLTAALFHQMAERRPESFAPLRLLIAGGETVAPAPARRVVEALPRLSLVVAYGPTESTTFATVWPLTAEEAGRPSLAIGRPIANTTAHVMEPGPSPEHPAPAGVWGELLLGGDGLARGYLGRPDLTAERFVPDPFGLSGGERLYRTGDLARRRPDGVLEILGRIDRQVKIRGHRIEPAEVEAALAAHPEVAEAAVLVRGEGAEKRLVAYVSVQEEESVRSDGCDRSVRFDDLRRWLAARLPEPMVPSAFVALDRLPLTPNGKVDRRALARIAPERTAGDAFTAPRTPAEQALAGLWLDVLGAERTGGRVGVHDHFFDLGGHSLLATRLIASIHDAFGVELPLRVLFERPTLEEVARAVEEAREALGTGSFPSGRRTEVEDESGPPPLSFSQERLWLLEQIDPGTAAYNIPGAIRLRGRLDVAALARAVAEIVRRHGSLRTTFAVEDGTAVQRIEPFDPDRSRLPLVDLSSLPAAAGNAEVRRLAVAEGARPFDLAAGPLFRATLLRLGAGEHVSLYTMHHVISDGWSMGVFFHEMEILYAAFAAGRPSPLPELPLQYAGFARRQRRRLSGAPLEQGLAAWRRLLSGVPPLELPTDRPRPARRSWRGSTLRIALDSGVTGRLSALGRDEQATLFMVLLAVFQTFLHRFARQDDVAVGTAVANRTDLDVGELIGFFVNSLVLRTDLSGDPPFREIVRRARRTALEAFRLQEIPFEKVVEAVQPERHASRAPLFQVMLTLENLPRRAGTPAGIEFEPVEAPAETAKFDLTLSFAEGPAGLAGALEYDLDLFDPATAGRMVRHLTLLAEAAVIAPGRRISEIPLLTSLEREQILLAWNRTAARIPALPLHRLFEEQVDRAPDAVAVAAEGEELTYAQLDTWASRLAYRLRRMGAGPEVAVAVLDERSPGMIAALLAVMKSGGFFVPLDPAHPRERLAALLAQAGARLAVTRERFLDLLPEGTASLCLDRDRGEIDAAPSTRPEGGAVAESLLYMMFTSGSTGAPKGVAVTHGNVVRLVRGTDFADFGPGETFLMLAPVSFDVSTLELWGPLANGGRLAIFPPHTPSLDELAAFLLRFDVTQLWLTAGLFHQMVDRMGAERPRPFAGLRRLLAGGDALSPDHVRRALAAHPGLVLVDGYGPTESTTFATCQELTAPGQVGTTVPIGKPIANTTVHVLEPGLEPAPLGVWGELYIGGQGLARGYAGRPDLTAERFVPDPSATLQGMLGGRLYRTGDLVRRRPDGVLEFLGRVDRQVKIRGFRVEPAEIEAVLTGHPEVAEAAVLVRGEGGEKRLVAYVAYPTSDRSDRSVRSDDLRRWLAGRLPEPMIPSAFVAVDRLPLTPNGKVDRKALAQIAPERGSGDAFVAPRTPVEEILAGLWVEILGAERTGGRVGVHDHFFALGGHSLLATRLMAAVRDVFQVELPLRVVFEQPTLEEVARAVEEAQRALTPGPSPASGSEENEESDEEAGPPPLSFSQERLWLLEQIDPGTAAYNIPGGFRLRGPLDVAALAGAVAEIVRRHDALRTTFAVEAGEPVQRVEPFDPGRPVARLPLVDGSALPAAARSVEADRLAAEEALRPFDLAAGPLFRTILLRLAPEEHVALYTMHHIVSDGWSMDVFFREVGLLYASRAAGRPSPLPPLPLQYTDYARRQRRRLSGPGLEEGLAAWRRLLAGVAPLELPADRPRPATRSWRGSTLPIPLEPGLSARLADLARDERATLYMVLLALVQTFLHRLAGQDDVAVGSPVANRTERDVEGLIGFFVNSLVLRTDLSGDPSVREVVQRARRTALEAFRLQEIPFEKVVEAVQPERHTSRAPLFQVMLTLQNTPQEAAPIAGLDLEVVEAPGETAKFDLTLGFSEGPGGLAGAAEVDLDLFDPATARRMVRHLSTLIEAAVAEPGRRISELPLLAEAEQRQVLALANQPPVSTGRARRALPRLFEEQVDRTPEAPAVSHDGTHLTYRELDARANRLARWLVKAGVVPGDRVALCLDRSVDMVVGLLGILKAGGAYLPLDPAYPRERLAFSLDDSGAALVLTTREQAAALPETRARVALLDGGLDGEAEEIARRSAARLDLPLDPELPAYVIYTSGSTGRPKGVVIPHGNVSRLFFATKRWFAFGPQDVWTLFHSYAFDFSVWEIWGALLYGGRLVVVPYWVSRDPEAFWRLLIEEGVTVLNQTPSAFRQLGPSPPAPLPQAGEGCGLVGSRLAESPSNLHPSPACGRGAGGEGFPLRWVIFGGEALDPTSLEPWFDRYGDQRPRLVNMYGITETTVHVTFRPLTREDAARPASLVGKPIPDLSLHVLDRHLQMQPLGVPGEICVGGAGLAQGYLGRPELTAERFVPDPFGEEGARLYRSGDLARRRPDGDLEFLGRIDQQVKIRGFRIELGEIESALAAHPAVREAAVLALPDADGQRLVAYAAVAPPASDRSDGSDRSVQSEELRQFLAGRLPEHMIPSGFVILERLPLTANGKVDRKELGKIAPERSAAGFVAPRTPVEEVLAGLFVEVLGEERTGGRVGAFDNFFELGGHSLAATRLVSRLRAALGVELPLRALFEAPTVAALAERCGSQAADLAPEVPLVATPRDPAGEPLSFSQERLWFLDRLTPGTATYNLPSPARLRGPLDPARLASCFAEVVHRHEALRTRFSVRDGSPVQIVDPPAPLPLPLIDLTALPEERRRAEAERQAAAEAEQPFDLERGPLVRSLLVRLDAAEHDLLLDLHHIVTDGWSMGILFRELAHLYAARTEGRPSPLPELPVQVADAARWQRERLAGPALEAQLGYWRERLAGAPAALDLPLDRTRPAVQTFRGDAVLRLLPAEPTGRLRALARREGASLFMVLLAGLDLLLARQSGQDDVLVGTPVAGRDRPELEGLIGCFLNTLVLRVDLSGGPAARALIHRAREAALGAYAHQDVPFEKLLQDLQPERDLSRTPLFQVFLNLLNFPDAGARLPDGLVLEPLGLAGVDSKFDLTIYAAEEGGGLSLSLVYNADLFDRTRMEELSRQLQGVLEQLAEAPDAPVDAISLLTPEAMALLPDPRAGLDDAWVGSVHALFAEQARRRPEKPAVADAEGTWTYGDLAEAVSRLAARLRADGLAPGEPVAIWAHRGAPVAWAMMAAAWAGGAFVMLDPDYPAERLVTLLELAAPRYWIELAAAGPVPSEVEEALERLGLRGRVRLPGGGPAGARSLVETLPPPVDPAEVGPDDLAYLAFTSGSTGTPKGIEGRHGPLSHFLPFLRERFALTDEDRTSLLSGLAHDPLQRDVFTPLCLGASLVAPTADEVATPGRLAAWMEREGITIAHLTPAMAQLLTEGASGSIPTLRWVLLVGDVLTRLDVDRLRRLAPRVTCVNLYGSTETQRSVAYHVVEEREIADARAPQVLPLGRGMRDVQLLVVSRGTGPDGAPRLAGIGEVGEIWMRGPHLARGYRGDEALTADRFRANPFTDTAGDRVYRTGDLGRYRPDGEATFAGRADQQVKIRGFRIELGEIEAVLGRQPGVRESVVIVREDGGERYLAAYVVPEGEPGELETRSLREALRKTLPDSMIPAAFVVLDRLPLTPNRKVDRRALPAPDRSREEAFVAPRTPVEETLAGLFVELLGTERTGGRVGARQSFFELGGHSLLATRLIAAIRDAFRVELPLRVLFEKPTVEQLALAVADAGEAGAPVDEPVAPVPREPGVNRFPVSFSQLREWILDRLEPGNPAYNIPNHLRIGGPLSVAVLAEALNRLAMRHEVFRTQFEGGEEEPLQAVLPEVSLQVPVIDLSGLPAAAREAELVRRVRHFAGTGFDLAAAPLLRAWVVRLGAEDHALLMAVHHIVSDGWSTGILNQELTALYEAAAAARPSPLLPLPVQYADYAVWLRRRLSGEALERQAGYWRQRLAGAPPLLELPTDRPRPPVRSGRGARIPFLLPPPLANRLEELARRHGATLFMVLLAGYQSLLARWSGQDDVVVGTYSGNRPRKELEGLIGFFINTLVLRTGLEGDPSFLDLLGRVRETTLGAYAHREVPFEKLLETLQLPRDPSRTPLFQALLVLQNFPPTRADLSTGVRLEPLPVEGETADYDLALWLGELPDGVGGEIEYSTDLFDESTLVRFADHLRTLLEAAVADPARNVWTLPLAGEDEQARQLEAWSRGPAVPEGPPLLHRLVEEQAAKAPEAVALEAGTVRLTYAELVEQASRQAHGLRERGVGPGSIVALSAERTPELIVSMLAVLQAGGAYLPIDPGYPAERRDFMVTDSGAVSLEEIKDEKGIKDSKDESSLSLTSLESLPSLASPETPAYVIYTSGSTGRPKGVVVPHRAIASFVRAASATYDITPGARVLQFASISFDTSAEEIWPALASGATLVLRPDDMAASIPHFLRELERLAITHLDLPTAFWHEMVAGMEAEDLALPRDLRLVILGGEEALADRFAQWSRRVGPSVRLVNTYGPTETTIVATRRELADLAPGAALPIGRPIPGARAYVLDRFLTPVPPGVRGELWIGGAGVAQGYLGRPDLTADRFRPDPFGDPADRTEPTDRSDATPPLGARLYRTGDLAFLRPDGDLVFAGRADRQLKIRGYRIEPGEIEAALRLHPALRDAVVDTRGGRDLQRLVAWIVPAEEGAAPEVADLRAFLRERLPEPLLPAAFVPVAALPLTPGGKVDRRHLQTLPEPAETRPENVAYAEPQSALERTIAEVYRDLLRVSRIGLHDNFFDLGGHSLLIVRAHQKLKEALGREIPVLDLFRFPTVAALARHLGGEETGNLRKVQGLAEKQRAAQQRQRAAMERLRRPDRK